MASEEYVYKFAKMFAVASSGLMILRFYAEKSQWQFIGIVCIFGFSLYFLGRMTSIILLKSNAPCQRLGEQKMKLDRR